MPKTAIFLDGAYIEKILEIHFQSSRIDYRQLVEELAGNSDLLRAYYYHCPPYRSPEPTPEETQRFNSKIGFFNALAHIPRFQIRLGRLAYRGNDSEGRPIFVQKAVDVLMSVDMVQLAATRAVDRVVIMAGDSDFTPAVEAVKTHGVLTTLVHGPPQGRHNGSDTLWETCDERVTLTTEMVDVIRRTARKG